VAKFVDLVGLVAKFVDLGGQTLWQDVLAQICGLRWTDSLAGRAWLMSQDVIFCAAVPSLQHHHNYPSSMRHVLEHNSPTFLH